MARTNPYKLLSLVLGLALVVSLGHGFWRNWWWKSEVFGLAGWLGTDRAMDDFQDGKLRLFIIDGERDHDTFTGRVEGPFEIWTSHFSPSLGFPTRYSTEQMVEFYNSKMKYMQSHPEKFQARK